MLSVFDWVLDVMNEAECVTMNEWIDNCLSMSKCCLSGCVTEIYFRRIFQLGKNVRWYEWLCDDFQYLTMTN